MLDNHKITLMTRLALFEKETGKEDFRLAGYYRSDYMRFDMLKTFVCTTAAFGIIVLMLAVYKAEYFLKRAADMQYGSFLMMLLSVYLLVLLLSEGVTVLISSRRIRKSRERLGKYYHNLRVLRKYYREQEEQP